MGDTVGHGLLHVRGEFIRVNGAKLWIESDGRGDPLVLVAGGPGASHTYMHGFAPLAKTHRLIYYDALGCGRSDRAAAPAEYTLERAVADLDGVRSALNLESWNVLGHSYGGMVGQAYALAHPARVKRLVLANTLASTEAWQASTDMMNTLVAAHYPERWSRVQKLRAEGLRSSSPEHQKLYQTPPELIYYYDASNVSKTVFEINQDVYYAMCGADADFHVAGTVGGFDFRPRLRELQMPVLVLAGRYDRLLPPSLTLQFKECAPKARFVMFEKSGHQPYIEEPELTFSTLNDFLGS
jgi:proline iminopeptidase